jgi:hypothetical protein
MLYAQAHCPCQLAHSQRGSKSSIQGTGVDPWRHCHSCRRHWPGECTGLIASRCRKINTTSVRTGKVVCVWCIHRATFGFVMLWQTWLSACGHLACGTVYPFQPTPLLV